MSNEFEIEVDKTEDKYSTNNKQGKRSPTSLIPVCKVFYLHTIQIYFAAPIVACGIRLQFLSTALSMSSAGYLHIARAVLVVDA